MDGQMDGRVLRFAVLGRVQVWRGGEELDVGPRQQRQLLALLLVRAGALVEVDEIIEVLWGGQPPTSAANLVHRYVGNLRRLFEPELAPREVGRLLIRAGSAYRLDVDAENLDLARFRRLAREAAAATEQGDPAGALRHYREALSLWHGPCAVGLGDTLAGWPGCVAVNHEHVELVCAAARTAREVGAGGELLPVVSAVATEHPFNERVQSQFLLLLAATGHQADAVRAYHTVRAGLAEELGIDPGPELRAAYQLVLDQQAGTAQGGSAEQTPERSAPPIRFRPDQLPPELTVFAGRDDEIASLESIVDDETGPARTAIVVIDGMPGMGKTTLAVRWAHELVERFPDGSLYVNLHGFSEQQEQPAVHEVLRGFLVALGVPAEHVPEAEPAASALFRSLLSGKRMVLLLDNARDVEQVRPLLPGRSGCLVIATSRNRLTGLVAQEGARPLTLHSLTPEEGLLALRRRLGSARVAAEPTAADRIVALCGGLPLAIGLVAARAAAHPGFSLSAIANSIAEAGSLRFGDTDVGSVFSWSYRQLTPPAARLFRLFPLVPGADLGGDAVASLLGCTPREAQAALNELTRNSLLGEHLPGRYSTHDLIRLYAQHLAVAEDTDEECRRATRRLLDFYVHTAYAAHKALGPNQTWSPPPPAQHEITARPPVDRPTAMAWFLLEYRVFVQAVRIAVDADLPEHAWRLALTMDQFFQRQCLWHEWEATMRVALDATRRSRDLVAEADVTRSLAGATYFQRRYEEALGHLRRTATLYTELGHTTEWAYLENNLGMVRSGMGDHQGAIEHYTAGMRLYHDLQHRKGEASAMYGVARAHSQSGSPERAIALCHEAMRIFEEIDDVTDVGNCWMTLGSAHHALGQLDEAIDSYLHAIECYRKWGDRFEEAQTLSSLAETYVEVGAHDAALAMLRASRAVYEALGLPAAEDVAARISNVVNLATWPAA